MSTFSPVCADAAAQLPFIFASVDSRGAAGIAGALMSSDLLFLGAYTCPSGYLGPEDCTFGALNYD